MEPSSAPWRVLEPAEPTDTPATPGSDARDRPWIAVGAVLAALAIAVLAFLLAARSGPDILVEGAAEPETGSPVAGAAGLETPGASEEVLVVEVGGAVVRPGVYRLAPAARVGDAIDAAGGFGPRVDLAQADLRLNLAAPLRDGDEIHVPVRGEAVADGPGSSPAPGGPQAAGALVDLNHASAAQLDTLPGVGPATAAKIIAAREEQPFASVDELGSRKVVGPATLEKLRGLVTLTP